MVLQRKIFDTIKESYSYDEYNDKNNIVSYEDFLESCFEFVYQTDIAFNQLNESLVLKEESYEVSVVNSQEKVKKSLIETIKGLFTKFVNFCKTQIEQFINWIKDKYMNTNVSDSIMQKIGKGIKYEDLKIARAKGWKGTPVNYVCVDPAGLSDISIMKELVDFKEDNDFYKICEEIASAQDLNQAQEKYNDLTTKLNNLKASTRAKSAESENFKNSLDIQFNFFKGENIKMFFYISPHKNKIGDKEYYYPTQNGFIKTKLTAEKGESFIKTYKDNLNKYLKSIEKDYIDPAVKNVKSYEAKGSNITNNKEINKINLLYNKAKLNILQATLKSYSNAVTTLISLLKLQHEHAIRTYLYWVVSTRKYVTESAEITAEEILEIL